MPVNQHPPRPKKKSAPAHRSVLLNRIAENIIPLTPQDELKLRFGSGPQDSRESHFSPQKIA